MMPGEFKTLKDNVSKFVKSVENVTKQQVLVGIPDKAAARKEDTDFDTPNNATIGYINEFGDAALHIPARPFLIPGVEKAKDQIIPWLKQAATYALDYNDEMVSRSLHKCGLLAQNSVRKQFTENNWDALAPMTLEARKEAGFKGTKPLIVTGQLRKSNTYIVRTKS